MPDKFKIIFQNIKCPVEIRFAGKFDIPEKNELIKGVKLLLYDILDKKTQLWL